jgi:hypothetical protein
VSIVGTLPKSYRFTEADVDRGMEIFMKYMNLEDVSDEEAELEIYTQGAWDIHCQTKKWPTVAEVSAYLEKQKEEAEQRYFNSLSDKGKKNYLERKAADAKTI